MQHDPRRRRLPLVRGPEGRTVSGACPTCHRPRDRRQLRALIRAVARLHRLHVDDREALLDDLYALRRGLPTEDVLDLEAAYEALWAKRRRRLTRGEVA